YHIFGSTEDSSSLLLSHDDLFDFFKRILGEQNLPRPIKKFFKEDAGGEVVFLGFVFRKWYVQLLLRLFNLSKTDNELNRTAYLNAEPPDAEKTFAAQHFSGGVRGNPD
ncbi:MAG: SIR2 family protein, partial [Microcoleus sp. C1-bin4]|nr:SIR2 family protein [Microcoleus sp. C1-bin4]